MTKSEAKGLSGSFGEAVLIALVLALFLLSAEALASLLLELGGGWALFWRLMNQIIPKMVVVMGTYLILWLLARVLLVNIWQLDGRSVGTAIAVFLASNHGLWLVIDRARVEPIQVSVYWVIAALLVSVVLSGLAYRTARPGMVWKGSKRLGGLLLAAPVVVLETLLIVWLTKPLGTIKLWSVKSLLVNAFSSWALPINIVYFFAIGVTLVLFVRSGVRRKTWKFVVFLSLLLMVVGVILPIVHAGIGIARRSNSQEQHSIRKVILIVIDALRADSLSCYGSECVSTPNIDALGADGILFERAYSSSSWTVPSVSSILTGVSPWTHQVLNSRYSIPEKCETFAERMKEAGYLTGAIGHNPHLHKNGYQQGFVYYDFYSKSGGLPLDRILWLVWPERFSLVSSTSRLTKLAQELMEKWTNKDTFLWLHYFDPHNPYTPPSEYLGNQKQIVPMKNRMEELKMIKRKTLTVLEKERFRKLYEGEVRYVDAEVGELLNYLKSQGLYENSLIVLTSDHGEEFWEHGGYYHGRTLYNESLRVPLIIKLPNSEVKGRVSEAVSNECILPTVLELCRIGYDSAGMSGDSLSHLWSGESMDERQKALFSKAPHGDRNCEMVLFENRKYIRWPSSGKEEFYDLEKDPHELENLFEQKKQEVVQAKKLLREWAEDAERIRKYYGFQVAEKVELDAQTLKQLRTLGYVDDDVAEQVKK